MGYRELPSEEDMSADFRDWIKWLPVNEQKPANTIKAYNQGVRRIISFAEGAEAGKFGPKTFDQISLIEAVRAIIQSDTVSNATLNQSLSGLQSFYDWCVNTKRDVRSNDLPDIKRLRKIAKLSVPQVDPDYFRPEELRRLCAEAANPEGLIGKSIRHRTRDLAICSFLAVLGLRASELIGAKIGWVTQETLGADGSDQKLTIDEEKLGSWPIRDLRVLADHLEVDHDGLTKADLVSAIIEAAGEPIWVLQVVGKGGKKRRLPLSEELVEANERWQAERVELQGVDTPRPGDYLFVPLRKPRGGSGENKFSYYQLWYLLQVIAREAGLRELGAHALRHTAGVQMALDGVRINMIQGLLGHASIATTGIYTELAATELLSPVRDSTANRIVGEILNSAQGKTGGIE